MNSHAYHTRPVKRPMALLPKLVVLLFCGWLFALPQVQGSRAMKVFCEEQGCTVPPLAEEEEVGHSAIPPRACPGQAHASAHADEPELPHWEELMLHTLHGEVPHPPPWA